MKNKIKKILSSALTVALLCGLCSSPAANAAEKLEWILEPSLLYEYMYYEEAGVWSGSNGDQTDIISYNNGKMNILSTKYKNIRHFAPNRLIVGEGEDYYNLRYGVIDTNGNVIIPIMYDSIYVMSDTMLRVNINTNNGFAPKYGVMDINGNEILPVEYDDISMLTDTLIRVSKRDVNRIYRYGVLDINGNVIIPMEYDDVRPLTDSLVCVCERYGNYYTYRCGAVDINGNEIIPMRYGSIEALTDTLLRVEKLDDTFPYSYGVIDTNGNEIAPIKYYSIEALTDTRLVVCERDDYYDSYGVIDTDGNEIIPIKYYNIYKLTDTLLAAVKRENYTDYYYGVLDIDGNEIVPFKYDDIYALTDTCFCVIELDKKSHSYLSGIMDTSGDLLVPPKYRSIDALTDTLFIVSEKNYVSSYSVSYGVIDINENEIIPITHNYMYKLTDKLLAVEAESDQYNIMDLSGEYILPEGYTLTGDIYGYDICGAYEAPDGTIVMVQSQDGLIGFVKIQSAVNSAEYDYEISSVSVKSASGESLAEIPQGEAFSVNADVIATAAEAEVGVAIAAVYGNDGALLYMAGTEADLEGASEKTFSLDIPAQSEEIDEIKIMVWHSLNDMQPMAEYKTI